MVVGQFGEQCVAGHSAAIYDRGGASRVSPLVDLSTVDWTRSRNDVTDASVVLNGKSCQGQQGVINGIEPRRHELVIFRGTDRVWEGPIVQVSSQRNAAVITAKDIGEYLNYTPLTKAWPTDPAVKTLMTDRIAAILNYELSTAYTAQFGTEAAPVTVTVPRWEGVVPPANIKPFLEVRAGHTLTRSNTIAFEMTVMEHLKDLATSGIDFASVGRKLLVWDSHYALGRTRQVTEADFYGDVEVILSGSDLASIYHVIGKQSEEEGTAPVGNARTTDGYYGPWTMIRTAENEESEDSEVDQWALNSQAHASLQGRYPTPIELRMPGSAGIRLSHDLTIHDLLPGVEMPVLATLNLRKVSQMQIIDKMTVSEDSSGENISVTLVPSGPAMYSAGGGT
jgi:hypothetical protein